MNVDRILELLDQRRINQDVLLAHDIARETFRLPTIAVRNHHEFNYLIQSYVQHHLTSVGQGQLSDAAAFGEAKQILNTRFGKDRFQEGYAAALQQALDGNEGGMRAVLNELATTLKQRALEQYLDHVFYEHINVLSKHDNRALSRAFFERFGPILRRFGMDVDEDTFAWNTRAALDYHRQVLEHILGIAKKI
jgi:hypothetical protein